MFVVVDWKTHQTLSRTLFVWKVPESQFPRLNKWIENMKKDSAVKNYYLESKVHADFYKGYAKGVHNYDPEMWKF